VAADAPETLDERSLTLLLVDTLSKGYMHRTTAAGLALKEMVSSPTNEALFALSEAALGVLMAVRVTPDDPVSLRKEAITEAWLDANRAAARANAAVRAEVERLIAIETAEADARRPKVPAAGAGRQFRVVRDAVVQEPEDDL
jgi:hypothetical protein